MDEATAALDADTEQRVISNLRMRGALKSLLRTGSVRSEMQIRSL